MSTKVSVGGLQVAESLLNLINQKIIPDTGIDIDDFWTQFENIINEFSTRNKQLLAVRDEMQSKIDQWHTDHKEFDAVAYKTFF